MKEFQCSKCDQPAKFWCERCLEPYCSRECQVADWREHKEICYKLPNLLPINTFKTCNLGTKADGSKDNINEARRSNNNSVNTKSRNPLQCDEKCSGAKPKILLKDRDFTLKPKTNTSISNYDTDADSAVGGTGKIANWRTAYPPPTGFFDAMIQFVEERESASLFAWVTDLKYDSPLRKLLAEINRHVNQKEPINPDLVYPGALVAAPLSKILYRAEILDCSPEAQKANIRLIDYGNELRIPYNQMFAPIPIMVNLNAYAFRVCVPNDCGPLELESVITIKVVGEKQSEGFYNIECKIKSIPLELPVESLTNEPSLSVVKCFMGGRNALLRLNNIEEISLDIVLNSEQTIQYEFENVPNEGTFVAARTVRGWKRARLLGFFEKNHQFLVYTIDVGTVCLSPQIKRIPETFLEQSMSVFAVSTTSPEYMLSETLLLSSNKLSLQLLPATSVTAGKESNTHIPCGLYADNRKIVDIVIASVFTGNLQELDLKLWVDHILPGSCVFVSHVLTFKEIYIASYDTKEYSDIFRWEFAKCTPLEPEDTIVKGDLIFVCDKQGNKYRGEVIASENENYKIRNVDKGGENTVERKCLYKPTNLVRSLPVRCTLVKLMYLENMPSPVPNNKALAALESCMENILEFEVLYGDGCGDQQVVDLLFRTAERQSLCKKLLPMVFETSAVLAAATNDHKTLPNTASLPEVTPLPPSPPDTPITRVAPAAVPSTDLVVHKIYTLDDLEIVPIECGDKVVLYILDASTITNLESLYVTAADFSNKQFLSKMNKYLTMVADYCTGPSAPKAGYTPIKMEICLSIYADDNQWYRALCVDHLPNDMFLVMFIDYGNIAKVTKKNIMPITPELMFPSNANMVYIEGISTKEEAVKFAKLVQANPILRAKVVQIPESDAYLAKVHQLDKLIAN